MRVLKILESILIFAGLSKVASAGSWYCLHCSHYLPSQLFAPCDLEHSESLFYDQSIDLEYNTEAAENPITPPLGPADLQEVSPPTKAKSSKKSKRKGNLGIQKKKRTRKTAKQKTFLVSEPIVADSQIEVPPNPVHSSPVPSSSDPLNPKENFSLRLKRPPNKFFIYKKMRLEDPSLNGLPMAEKVSIVGRWWHNEPEDVKKRFTEEQESISAEFKIANPTYKYHPTHKAKKRALA